MLNTKKLVKHTIKKKDLHFPTLSVWNTEGDSMGFLRIRALYLLFLGAINFKKMCYHGNQYLKKKNFAILQ